MSRAFLKLHYDLLKSPDYQAFFASPANITYTFMLSHVYRPNRDSWSNHPLRPFYDFGWLVTDVTIKQLAGEQPSRSRQAIMRDIARLDDMGLVDVYPSSGERNLYVLGRWGWVERDDRLGRRTRPQDRWEHFYVDNIFGGIEVPWG